MKRFATKTIPFDRGAGLHRGEDKRVLETCGGLRPPLELRCEDSNDLAGDRQRRIETVGVQRFASGIGHQDRLIRSPQGHSVWRHRWLREPRANEPRFRNANLVHRFGSNLMRGHLDDRRSSVGPCRQPNGEAKLRVESFQRVHVWTQYLFVVRGTSRFALRVIQRLQNLRERRAVGAPPPRRHERLHRRHLRLGARLRRPFPAGGIVHASALRPWFARAICRALEIEDLLMAHVRSGFVACDLTNLADDLCHPLRLADQYLGGFRGGGIRF